jgi:DNA sulfur modification protein DndB
MIENILPAESLGGVAAKLRRPHDLKSFAKSDVEDAEQNGWVARKIRWKSKKSTPMMRPKQKSVLLEHRVWSLLYKMGFKHLSGQAGARLRLDPKDPQSPPNQIDVVGIEDEIALAVECKTASRPRKAPSFQKSLAKHALTRQEWHEDSCS